MNHRETAELVRAANTASPASRRREHDTVEQATQGSTKGNLGHDHHVRRLDGRRLPAARPGDLRPRAAADHVAGAAPHADHLRSRAAARPHGVAPPRFADADGYPHADRDSDGNADHAVICDPAPPPSATPMIFDPPPAPSSFRETPPGGVFATLPLAEIRSVAIERSEALTFTAKTPWPGAHLRWTASGGTLLADGQAVTWQPPDEPGRYLLQVVADWGQVGLAVDTLVLEVGKDGRVAGA